MIEVIPYAPHHALLMHVQPGQELEAGISTAKTRHGEAITVTLDGLPMVCAGLIEIWPGRAYAWALLDKDAGRVLLRATKEIRSRLDRSSFARVEMAAAVDFEQASRWAMLLGFKRECLARKYLPDGRDAFIFVRV